MKRQSAAVLQQSTALCCNAGVAATRPQAGVVFEVVPPGQCCRCSRILPILEIRVCIDNTCSQHHVSYYIGKLLLIEDVLLLATSGP